MRIIKVDDDVFSLDYYFIFIGMLACFIVPDYFLKVLPGLGFFLTALSLFISLLYILINYKKVNFIVVFGTNIFLIWLIITTFINNKQNVIAYIFQEWKTLMLCCVISCVIHEKQVNKLSFIRVIRDMTLFFFILNLFVSIFFRNGIPNGNAVFNGGVDSYYLYGNANAMVRAIFPGILCSMLLDRIHKKRISNSTGVFFAGFLFIFLFVYHMVTGLLALMVLLMWVLLKKYIKRRLKLVYGIYMLIIGYIELGIIQLVNNGNGWITKIALFFGKSTDFSGRYYVWRRALLLYKQSPKIGWGFIKYDTLRELILNGYGAHNYFLDIAINGGYVGVMLFIMVVLSPLIILKTNLIDDKQYMIFGGWVSLLMMLISEPLRGWEFLFIPILCSVLIMNMDKHKNTTGL